MLKTLNTRISVQNDKFSTKNVEKTVDKTNRIWYYMQAFRRDAKRCWKVNRKKFWKTFKKVLTNERVCDILLKLSTSENFNRERKESRKAESEKIWKKSQKTFKKSIDKRKRVWYTLWAVFERGQAIGPWKLNNEIRKGTRDSMIEDIIKKSF